MSNSFKRAFHSTRKNFNVITVVCPGQGNISPNLFRLGQYQIDNLNNPKYKQLLSMANETIPDVPISKYFSKKTYPDNNLLTEELSKTSFVQPLVLLSTYFNYSIFKDMFDWDIYNANYLLGHSLGELSALVIQDVISLEDGLNIAYQRGKLMEDAIQKYDLNNTENHKNSNDDENRWGMVALMFQERDFKSILKVCQDDIKFNVANINGYGQIVVSGKINELKNKLDKLDEIQKQLVLSKQWKSRIRKVFLQTEIPAHHPIFDDIKEELRSLITLKSDQLYIPIVCNLNGLIVTKNSQRVVDNFIDVTSKPVQFVKCLETLAPCNNGSKKDEIHKFLNVSDVTFGLIKRFYAREKRVEVYDLINEANKELVK